MKKIFFLFTLSFLIVMIGFYQQGVEAKEEVLPIGEMVSSGDVKFELKEKVWKEVEPSHFPIFHGIKIKTENGRSIITLTNHSQINLNQNSILSFDQADRLHLMQGAIHFHIPSTVDLGFRVGHLTIIKSQSLQASKNHMAYLPEGKETIGSIFIHPNGSVTIKSIQGELSVIDQDHVVTSSLSSKDSVTIPSAIVKGSSKRMMAQAGETRANERVEEPIDYTWGYVAAGVIVSSGVGIGLMVGTDRGVDRDWIPLCRP